MPTHPHFLPRCLGLVALAGGLALAARAQNANLASEVDAFPTFESYVKVSGYAPYIAGDHAAFSQNHGFPAAGAFGIEDMAYDKDVSNDTNVAFTGHAMQGSEDYLAQLDITTNNLGSVEMGYKRFRIFYDGVGGFFPLSNTFQEMSPEGLHVDRSAFWANFKLARPGAPVFTLSYRNEIRTGDEDSTEWGLLVNPTATVTGGALVGTAAPANTIAIAPNLQALAEHHQMLEGAMTAELGRTTETLRATLEWVGNVDTRYYTRYAGSNVVADPAENVLDDQESVHSHSLRVINQTDTALGDRLTLEVGLSYFDLLGADGGEWITPSYSTTAKAIFPTTTAGNIFADPHTQDFVGNVFLKYAPNADWRADLGFRQESNLVSDQGGFITTSLASTATSLASTNVTTANDVTYSHFDDHVSTPELSVNYLGISGVTLYGTADVRVDHGNQHWINPYAAVTTTGTGVVTTAPAPISSIFFQEANEDNDDAKLGANWNVSSSLILRGEVFRQDHWNRFIGSNEIVATGSFGALYDTGYTFTGVKLSAVYRPIPTLSFNTRYQPQAGSMSVTASAVSGGMGTESPSGKVRAQIVSETVDWTPYRQLYLEASANVVYNYIQTAYPTVVVSTTAVVPPPFHNANNNYIVGSTLVGFVLDKLDDIQVQGTWQQADNYNRAIAIGGVPYGATYMMESATAGVKHKFGTELYGEAKAGYLRSTDGTTNGLTNYHGPLFYVSLTYSL